jgi:hypothetical protein
VNNVVCRPTNRYTSDEDDDFSRVVIKRTGSTVQSIREYPQPPKRFKLPQSTVSDHLSGDLRVMPSAVELSVAQTSLPSSLSPGVSLRDTPVSLIQDGGNGARDHWLVVSLQELHAKVDSLTAMMQNQSGEYGATTPSLPTDINLPLDSVTDLRQIEQQLDDIPVKNAVVSIYCIIICLTILLRVSLEFLLVILV